MSSHNFREARLLFREMPEPQERKAEKPLDSIKGSLQTLESSMYKQIIESTKNRALTIEHGSRIECTDAAGTRSFSFQSGNLIQKEQDGFLMISGSSMVFVPNEQFTGSISAVQGGKRTVVRQAFDTTNISTPKTFETTVPKPQAEANEKPVKETRELPPSAIQIRLSGNDMGITSDNGTTLTFLQGETSIANALGRLTRSSTDDTNAVFTPAQNLQGKVYVGKLQVFPSITGPSTPAPVAPAVRSQKQNFQEKASPKPRPPVETLKPSAEMSATVGKLERYLDSSETTQSIRGATRQFVRLYIDHWQSADPQGVIGNRLFLSQEFKQTLASMDAGSYLNEPAGLENKSRQALLALAEKLVGKENPTAEKNEYITQYNQLVRSGQRGDIRDIADMIYDRRNVANPRGRFDEKVGRSPLYRSKRVETMLQYRKERDSAFLRLSNASQTEAPALARAYRKYDNAYRAIRYMLGETYEKQWGDRERTITMNDGRSRGATLTQRVDAYWKKHLAIDTLMVEDTPHQTIVPNPALLRRAEGWLEEYAADYPSR